MFHHAKARRRAHAGVRVKAPRRLVVTLTSISVVLASGIVQSLPAQASGNYAAAVLSDSPTGFWRLAETSGTTAADASGHINVLTYSGGYTLGVAGSIVGDPSTAAQFSGSTGNADRTSSPVTSTTNWSVEAWVNPSNINQAGVMLYDGKEDTTDGGYGFAISSSTSLTTSGSELVGAVNGKAIDSGYAFTNANTWYDVVMTRDSSTIRFYVNGRITSKTSGTAPNAPSGRFSVGAGINSSGSVVQPFSGVIDDAAIYATALSAGRIADHYQEGSETIGGLGQWASLTPTVSGGTLSARSDPAIAYDSAHGLVVMFGGKNGSGSALAETWTYNGSTNTWTKLSPAHSPSARWGARMVFDAATNNVVLFGGSSGSSTFMSDTWTWSGSDWTQLSPGTVPPVRADTGMAYDSGHNVVVMFGGNGGTNGSTYYGTTYSWNGSNWTQAASTGVSARRGVAMAYDAKNSNVVLFGGNNGNTYLSDTYTWNGTMWSSTSPATSPSARTLPSSAFDSVVGKTVLFGGYNGSAYQADSWTWDGSNWALQNSSANPAARSSGAMVWDAVVAVPFLFGGTGSSGALGDSWNWTTPPDVPTNISGTSGNQQVVVSWTAPGNGGATISQYVATASPGGASTMVTGSPAPTNATVTGLTNGTAYTFTVVASNSVGNGVASVASAPVTPMTVPGAPTNVSATAGNAQATISWTAPASNGGSAITGYTVTSSPGGITQTAGPRASSATVTGLTNGTSYTFTVTATNAAGTGPASSPSNAVTPATVPDAPTNVTATAGNAQATVSWTAPNNGGATITSYTITASPGGATATVTGSPAGTTGTVTGLTNGISYTFTVTATNNVGTGPTSSASNAVTPATVPGAPTNVTATASNDQATVSWTAPSSNGGSAITGYTVTPYIGTSAGTPVGVSASSTSTTVTGLSNCSTYTFQVTASNSLGTGPAGTSNSVSPNGPPDAPSNVAAAGGNAQATVSWTAPCNGGSPLTGYTVTPYIGSTAGTPQSVSPSSTSTTVTGLINGTTYTFQVTATSGLGTSSPGTSNAVTPATVPQPPGNVTATAGNQQATVTWTAPNNGGSAITSYTVTPYVGSTAGTPVTLPSTETSTTFTSLTNGTTYTFQTYATNGVGNSAVATSNAVTPATVPGAPTNVMATTGNAQSTVSWTAPASNGGSTITSYTVTPYVGTTAGTPVTTSNGTTFSITVTGLTNGTTYTFQVYATNVVGNSSSTSSNAVTIGLPSAPTNVTATAGTNETSISWTASAIQGSSNIRGYVVTALVGSQPLNSVAVGSSSTSVTVSGLQGGSAYSFQVYAVNNQGNSPASSLTSPVTPTGSATTYASTVIGDAPSTYLRLNDPSGAIAADSSGQGNTGAYNSGYSLNTSSMIWSDSGSHAVRLDGSSGYVSAATVLALQGDNARSVELWFSSFTSTQEVLFDSGATSGSGQVFLIGTTQDGGVGGGPVTNTAGVYVDFGSSDVFIPGLRLGDGRTHHLVVTLQGSTLYVYVDDSTPSGFVYHTSWSALTAQPFTLPITPNTTANQMWIGRGRSQIWGVGSTYFYGIVNEFAVYPAALTAAQVNADFSAAGDGPPSSPGSAAATGGANQATISWTAPASNGAPITAYVVTTQASMACPVSNSRSVPASSTSAVVTGLPSGYCGFTIQAINGFGYSSVAATSGTVTITGSASTYASTVLGDSPVAYYRLGDTGAPAADSSGHGNSATVSGSVTQASTGALPNDADTAFNFSVGRVQDQSIPGLPSGTSPRSYEAWVKTTSAYSGGQMVVSYGAANGSCGYPGNGLAITGGNGVTFITHFDCQGFWSGLNFVSPYSIANGAWHLVAVTWDGSTATAYVDGQSIGSQPYTSNQGTPDGNGLYLGTSPVGYNITGSLDEISIYATALSASQVLNHFSASGNSRPSAPTGITVLAGQNKATITWNAAANSGSAISGYIVTAFQGSAAKNATSTASTSVTLTGLQGGVAYTFAVQAANNFGTGSAGTSGAVTPTGSTSTYASTVESDAPIYFYRLDDSSGLIADSSGNARVAYASGTYTQGGSGALANDGNASTAFTSNTYFQFAQGTGLPSGTAARSYEAWFRTTSTQDQALFSYATTAFGWGSYENGIGITGTNQVEFLTSYDNNAGIWHVLAFTAPYAITNGTWHQVVLTWDGANVTAYVDGQPIGSQAFTQNQGTVDSNGLVLGSVYGTRHLAGSLDEVSIYPSSLSASQVLTHFGASGNGLPAAPTGVTATSGENSATVSWTPPSPSNGAITGYTVTATHDGDSSATTVSDGSLKGATVSSLVGGQTYSFTVSAHNAVGTGPASASSAAITVTAAPNGSSPIGAGFGQYLYVKDLDGMPYPDGTVAFESENTLPTLSTWTVEGWLQLNPSTQTSGSGGSFGLITGQGGTTVAGVTWDQNENSSFVWPLAGGGQGATAISICGSFFGGCPFQHIVLEYDGTNISGYVNGSRVYYQRPASSAAISSNTLAGLVDHDLWTAVGLDEVRVSSVSRYTGTTITEPGSPFPNNDASAVLLWHLDEQGVRKMWQVTEPINESFQGEFPDSSGNHHGMEFYSVGQYCIACGSIYRVYALGKGRTAAELDADGSPWECPCTLSHTDWPVNSATGAFWHTFDDISVPGRGFGLDFSRTYSSADASALGPLGYGWSDSYRAGLTFGSANGVTAVTVRAGNGSAVAFTQNGSSFTAPGEVLASLVQNTDGSYTMTQQDGTKLNYDSSGRLTSQVDRNGYATTFTYDPTSGLLTSVIEPSQGNPTPRSLTIAYKTGTSLIQSVTDTAGRSVSFSYDANNNLTGSVDINGNGWQYSYDSTHEMTAMKSPLCVATAGCNGIVNVYTNGQVTQQTDAAGRATKFAYSSDGVASSTTITDPNNNVTVDEYIVGMLVSETKANGTSAQGTWTYTYDPLTQSLLTVTDPNGNTTTTVRDAQAHVLTQTDPRGNSTTYTYNSFGEVRVTTPPSPDTPTTNTYDSAGNLLSTSTPLAGTSQVRTTNYTYGDSTHPGDATAMTDPDNNVWQYTYDQYGNKASSTDPVGNETTYAFDLAGHMTSKVTPRGNVAGCGCASTYTWTYTYWPSGALHVSTDPLGHTTTDVLDADGNLQSVTDGDGHVTRYGYDVDDERTSETDGYGTSQARTIQTAYDGDGNVQKQINALSPPQTTTYVYDGQNHLISVTDPLNRQTTYTYDAAGNRLSMTDANGHVTNYAYDATNELVAVTYQTAEPGNVSYTYQADGRRLSMSDETGTTSYQYDSLGRVFQVTNGAGATVGYGYDLAGNITSIAYPGGVGTVTRTYYANGWLHTVSDWLGHTTTYNYDPDGNLSGNSASPGIVYPNGVQQLNATDAAERTMGITDGANGGSGVLGLTYTRDNANLLTGEDTLSYGPYDPLNRLPASTQDSYQYDAADRITQIAQAGTSNVQALSYDNGDQLTSSIVTSGGVQVSGYNYKYDANGNRLSQTDLNGNMTSFTWDQANHLIAYLSPGIGAVYTYNGDGLRTSKTVGGGATTQQTWDTAEGLPLIIQDGSNYYVTGLGGSPLGQISGTTALYYHEDQLGSVRAITDSSGNVAETYGYDPYGNVSASGSIAQPFQYAGQYCDTETGFGYLRNRYYQPLTAQFVSRDPASPQTREIYVYVRDNPFNSTDPSGRCDLALWIVLTAGCLAEKVAPSLRGTWAAAPVAAWAQWNYNAVDVAQQHANLSATACAFGCAGLAAQGNSGTIEAGGSVPWGWSIGASAGFSTKTADQRQATQLSFTWAIGPGVSCDIGIDKNGHPDFTDVEVDATVGFGWSLSVLHDLSRNS